MSRAWLLGGLVIVVAAAGVWYWIVWTGPAAPTPGLGQAAARRNAIAPKLSAVVLVNDARDVVVGVSTPVFVECVLTNPTTGALEIRATAVSPEVRDVAGARVSVSWERVSQTPVSVGAEAGASIRWVATTQLPAGQYAVGLAGADQVVSPESARVWVDPAQVTVTAVEDADVDAAAAIQLLAWRGQAADALAGVEQALAVAPDALVLQLWRADLLRDLGREADAQTQLMRLAAAIETRQRARPGANAEIPFWLAERLAGR